MLYILIFVAIVVITFVGGKINLFIRFNKQITELFSQSENISNQKFSYQQLEGLPEPVQRYFKHVLKDGQSYISYVRLKHNGQFKIDPKKDWLDIAGEQYFTTEKLGFIWKGTTSMFVVRDMYIGDVGRLTATLISIINAVNIKGEHYNHEALLRWLGESIVFPTALLPSEKLQWTAIDNFSAKLTFEYKALSLMYIISFNDKGEIVQMETKKRLMGKNKLETFIIKPTNYEEKNGVIIPTYAEAFWRLKEGDFSYAKFKIETIDYDIANRF